MDRPHGLRLVGIGIMVALLSACGPSGEVDTTTSQRASVTPVATDPGDTTPTASTPGLFDASIVHDVSITFDQAAYEGMIATYQSTREKAWIEASVVIDGSTHEHVGIRLKGNSSLRSLGGGRGGPGGGEALTADDPGALPWLIDLDHFVDGQQHDGVVEFVVRSNTSQTALNEALALELLEQAGLPSQDSVPVRFSANGGTPVLRLVIENPDDSWMARTFGTSGALYKAESSGDYSYRGDDPAAYDDVFDQEAGRDTTDLTPLIEFLRFINDADDATFAAEIGDRLDVEGFATYLAMQELLDNFDDIDGPGNNSYLHYDVASGRFTVVPWDYNLAFGTGFGGMRGGDDQNEADGRGVPGGGGPGGRSNVLQERFLAIDTYSALVEERQAQSKDELFESGLAADALAALVAVLDGQATDLVSAETIRSEAARIADSL
jgi:spore coat protein CotH